jgi:hypothetical protein
MTARTILALASFMVAFASNPVFGQESGQQACMQDAMAVCAAYIPNRERVATCLISNRARISPACRNALTHFDPHTASAR